MTVPSNKIKETYAGDGVTIAFPFTGISYYQVGDISALIADADGVETALVQDTDYEITVSGSTLPCTAGTLTMLTVPPLLVPTPPASGETLVLYRSVPYTQEIDLAAGGAMPAATLEEGYDRGTMMLQQIYERLLRSVALPISSSVSDLALPVPDALKFLRWSATEDSLENIDVAEIGGMAVSAFGKTLMDDADASAVLTTLGFSTFGKTLIDDTDAAAARATLGLGSVVRWA